MVQSPKPAAEDIQTLAILNHRAEPLKRVEDWFQNRGWKIKVANHLEESRTLLQTPVTAALVYPLTLMSDGLEWQTLKRLLSPHQDIPWLVVPWGNAAPSAVTAMLRGSNSLTDWLTNIAPLSEIDARLGNLMRLHDMLTATRKHTQQLEGQLVTDHKTGLFNDRHFRARLREEFERSQRHGSPVTLVLLDVDDFKQLNDSFSYEFGDVGLRTVGETLRQCVRSIDIPARIGGDEFAIILPSTTLPETVAVTNRIQHVLSISPIDDNGERTLLQASIGIATFDGRSARDPRNLFLQANEALKMAKGSGKNRLCFFDPNTRRSAGADSVEQAQAARVMGQEQADDNEQ
jgi:diguanylate cyclase (GGDEF)-like protein